jgi:two-component system, OmpR family, response regulator RegX3
LPVDVDAAAARRRGTRGGCIVVPGQFVKTAVIAGSDERVVDDRVEAPARALTCLDGGRDDLGELLRGVDRPEGVQLRQLGIGPEPRHDLLEALELGLCGVERGLGGSGATGFEHELDRRAHRPKDPALHDDILVATRGIHGAHARTRPGKGGQASSEAFAKTRLITDAGGGAGWNDVHVKLLLVEDDDSIAQPLAEGLRREGFEVERAATGAEALAAEEPDLVLLDLRLPDIDGLTVCRELRARSAVPIIVVSARGEEVDRVVGLELGADDYVVKPFGLRELVARIRAVARRTDGAREATDEVLAGVVRIDLRAHRVTVRGVEVQLTGKEFDLLTVLARDAGAVVDRERILREVWHTTWYGSSKTVDVHVAALRRKLGDPHLIETVRGIGLRLVA